jgi:predicted RNA methylase
VKISEATALIHTPLIEWARPQSWCDLGCGSGTFTTALAQLLASGSMIHAVDLDPRALEYVPDHHGGVEIRKTLGDIGSLDSANSSPKREWNEWRNWRLGNNRCLTKMIRGQFSS